MWGRGGEACGFDPMTSSPKAQLMTIRTTTIHWLGHGNISLRYGEKVQGCKRAHVPWPTMPKQNILTFKNLIFWES